MNTQPKTVTREELYAAVWSIPLNQLAKEWNTTYVQLVHACKTGNVPRPQSDHWLMVSLGYKPEQPLLPPPSVEPGQRITFKPVQKRVYLNDTATQPNTTKAPPVKPNPVFSTNLDHAHPLVKQTRQALKKSYRRHGLIQGGYPLAVEVSAEQQYRALRIMDVIVKALVGMGGRFEQERNTWRRYFLMGKQPVWFYLNEVKRRFLIDPELDEVKRKAKGYSSWDKYEWKGIGLLRFKITGHKFVNEQVWTETVRSKMEDLVPEIIECLSRVEVDGKVNQEREAEQKKIEAERQRQRDIEWRREYEENERRKSLVETSERWHQAQKLRQFVYACEQELQKHSLLSSGTAASIWLEWARGHAARLDPIQQGFLTNLLKRSTD